MKKMNLLKWKFAFLLTFCLVGVSYAAPAFDIVESVQSFVGPQEAIGILEQETKQLNAEAYQLKGQGKMQEALQLRRKSTIYSDLISVISQTNDVEESIELYFTKVRSAASILNDMTPVQISAVKSEVTNLLQD